MAGETGADVQEAASASSEAEREPEVRPEPEVRYRAFISYSHSERDAPVAREVQRFLEGYTIPRALREEAGATRLGAVFRDADELAAGGVLTEVLEEALSQSAWLIVICSPAAAASPWVAHEIEAFCTLHGSERVLAVLASGDPADAFPVALAQGVGMPGASSEPIAADLRPEVQGARRRAELLRLAAPLIGCRYDDVVQRTRTRRRGRIAVLTAIICVVLALAGMFALAQQQRVTLAHDASAAAQARQEALAAYEEGDRIEALRLALEGVSPGDDPLQKADERLTLAEVLGVYHHVIDTEPAYAIHGVTDASTLAVSQGAEEPWFSLVDSAERILIYDMATGAQRGMLASDAVGDAAFSSYTHPADDHLLVVLEDAGIACYDVARDALAWKQLDVGWVSVVSTLDDGRVVALAEGEGLLNLYVFDLETGEVEEHFELGDVVQGHASLDTQGSRVAAAVGDSLFEIDLGTGSVQRLDVPVGGVTQVELAGDGVYTMSSEVSSAEGASDTWDGHAVVCAYAWGDDAPLWQMERSWAAVEASFADLPFNTDATVHNVEVSEELGCAVLPIVYGSTVQLLDIETGEVAAEIAADAPIVDFSYVSSSAGSILCATGFDGARGMAEVGAGDFSFQYAAGYGFPTHVWRAQEVNAEAVRFAIACSAEELGDILVYRDNMALPDELGVQGVGPQDEVMGISVSDDGAYVAVHTTAGTLSILDGETFDALTVIDLPSQGIEIANAEAALITFPDADSSSLVICDPGAGETPPRAWKLDIMTGEVLATWAFPYDLDDVVYDGCITSGERGGCVTVAFPRGGFLGLVDTETLDLVEQFHVGEVGITDVVLAGDERYFVVFDDGTAALYDRMSLDRMETDVDGLSFETEFGAAQVAVAPDGSTIATVTPEEGLAVIDTETGDLIWQVPCSSTGREFVRYVSGGAAIVVQDSGGVLSLYDAEAGSLVAQTDEVVGLLMDVRLAADGTQLYVRTNDTVLTRLQVFELHEDALALLLSMEDAWAVSTGGDLLLARANTMYRQPIYTLDELEAMAREEIAAHEGQGGEER